jgi:hypothetical protein
MSHCGDPGCSNLTPAALLPSRWTGHLRPGARLLLARERSATTPAAAAAAAVHGYTTAFGWSAGIFAVGAIAALALFTRGVPQVSPAAEPAPALH